MGFFSSLINKRERLGREFVGACVKGYEDNEQRQLYRLSQAGRLSDDLSSLVGSLHRLPKEVRDFLFLGSAQRKGPDAQLPELIEGVGEILDEIIPSLTEKQGGMNAFDQEVSAALIVCLNDVKDNIGRLHKTVDVLDQDIRQEAYGAIVKGCPLPQPQ